MERKFLTAALMGSVLAGALALAPTGACAAEDGPQAQDGVKTTAEKVVVTAGRIPEDPKTVTQSMTVIPREELEKNQFSDLGQLLGHYGFDVQNGGSIANGGFSNISIRGLSTPRSSASFGDDNTSNVLILIDGRRAPSSNIAMIPMVSIERVEVLKGPGALQYGASAMGGVINIITKRGGDEWKASAEVGYGSWETTKGMGSISGKLGPVDIAGGISSMRRANDYVMGNGKTYGNTAVTNDTSYVFNAGVNFLDEHRIGVSFIGSEKNEIGDPYYPKERAPMGWSGWEHTPHNETGRGDYSWDVNYEGGYKDLGLSWNAKYFKGYSRYIADNNKNLADSKQQREMDTQGAEAQVSWNSKYLTVTGGGEWYNHDYRPAANYTWSPSNNVESNNFAGFALAKIKLFDDQVILSGGLRYDDYTLHYQGNNKKIDNTSYSLGARWNALEWLSFKANYGTSFKVPNALQLAGYTYGGDTYLGNPNLDPERARSWDAGFEINYKSVKIEASYFETEIEDMIMSSAKNYGAFYKFENLSGSALYRGIEAQASLDLGEFFDWPFQLRPYINLTHLFQYEDGNGDIIRHVRNLEMAYGLNFNYPEIGLTADLRFIYLGHKMEPDWIHADPITYKAKQVRTGGDTTMDFYITKTIWDWDKGGKLSLKGSVTNIMDVNYETHYGYPSPGRAFYVGLRYDY